MSKLIQISKAGWLKVFDQQNNPLYFTNLNQYETLRVGESIDAPPLNQPFYIELIKPGETSGERITFPNAADRDEVFRGMAEAL